MIQFSYFGNQFSAIPHRQNWVRKNRITHQKMHENNTPTFTIFELRFSHMLFI